MIKPYKNRNLDSTKPVKIYRNLNNNLLSIKQKNVVAHTDDILLKNPIFMVMSAGYKRVLIEKTKNVHAYVKGIIINDTIDMSNAIRIFYNPFVAGYFRDIDFNKIEKAKYIRINAKGEMFAIL